MSKRIVRLDASAIKDSSCFRRFWLGCIEGYREKKLNNDIHYGTCFHKCTEEIELTGDDFAGIIAAQNKWREGEADLHIKDNKKHLNLAHLTLACNMYATARKYDSIFTGVDYLRNPFDGKAFVEQKMSIPIYEDDDVLILLQGTVDGIVGIKNGCICIADWKTTSAYDSEDYFRGYKLSPQLKTYFYGLNYYREHYPESPLGKVLSGRGQIGAFIYGAFLSASKIVEFKRSEVFWFNNQVMDDYQQQLDLLVKKIRLYIGEGKLPPAEGSFNGACVSYTGYKCKYFNACAAATQMNASENIVYHVLNNEFKKVEYRPLDFGGGNKNKTNETSQQNPE